METSISSMEINSVGLIGYGEVGKIFSASLVKAGVGKVKAYDRLLATHGVAMREHAAHIGVVICAAMMELVADADLVISAVTASETLNVAREAAKHIRMGTYFLDVNSASPDTKSQCSDLINAAGGRYVESAVMTSVPPYGIKVPMLLGGLYAKDIASTLQSLGFDAKPIAEKIGVASAIKMCRSIMIKGMEAITIESFTTARAYGVEREVLASLMETFPETDWEKQGSYFFERVVQHGKRRAEEMRESAATVRDIGLEPLMASAIADRQASIAGLKQQGVFKPGLVESWRDRADAILRRVKGKSADEKR